MASTVYEPKNVLITGGAGFIASHVAILFAKKYPHYKVRERAPWTSAIILPICGFFFFLHSTCKKINKGAPH